MFHITPSNDGTKEFLVTLLTNTHTHLNTIPPPPMVMCLAEEHEIINSIATFIACHHHIDTIGINSRDIGNYLFLLKRQDGTSQLDYIRSIYGSLYALLSKHTQLFIVNKSISRSNDYNVSLVHSHCPLV